MVLSRNVEINGCEEDVIWDLIAASGIWHQICDAIVVEDFQH